MLTKLGGLTWQKVNRIVAAQRPTVPMIFVRMAESLLGAFA